MKRYKAVYNTEGDWFGCLENDEKTPRVMTKKEWIEQLNDYQQSDELNYRYKLSDWNNLDDFDWRGIVVKEVK